MTLQPLREVLVETKKDWTHVCRMPNNEEIMNKINEIIDVVNKLEQQLKD